VIWAAVAGAAAGVLSGLGIGGGTALVIYMVNIAGVGQAEAQGVNLLYFLPTAAASLVSHVKNKFVDWKIFFFCAVPGAVFAVAGSFAALAMDTGVLRRVFGGLLILAGAWQVLKKKK